jgi:hypothetical protein
MPQWQGKRTVTVVTACKACDGSPTFALNEVEVKQQEYENGVHYDLVEERLKDARYERPWLHSDEFESPRFFHVAVKLFLGIPVVGQPIASSGPEEP